MIGGASAVRRTHPMDALWISPAAATLVARCARPVIDPREHAMRPMLVPGMRWAWRSPDTVQFGIDVPEPVVVAGLPPLAHALLQLLDGHRPLDEVVTALSSVGGARSTAAEAHALIDRLTDLGVVVDGGSWPGALSLPPDVRARLAPDLRCASVLGRFRSLPATRWQTLASSEVVVVGASRLGATIARMLVDAALGRVTIKDAREVTAADVSAGGFGAEDVGLRRSEWLSSTADRASCRSAVGTHRRLTVVTDAVETDLHCRSLFVADKPHLAVSARELIGRVGPLVEPGRSPCHFCLTLAHRDRDPAWASIWRQQRATATPDVDALLVNLTAAAAVAHVVDWLTGGRPPSIGGFVEITYPQAEAAVRRISQHPECGCAWPEGSASPTMAG